MSEAIQKADKGSSLAKRSMQKMLINKLAMIGAIIVVIFILMSIFAPIITPHDPSKIDMAKLNQPPSSEHIFGTDSTGRDIFSRLSIDLAKHAYEKGADAISSVPPFYWRFDNESIFQYYKEISESTQLPMIVYNVPLAGLMGIDMIYKLAEIDNVKGIKYTATNHFEINLIKDNLGKDFMLYSGSDEMAALKYDYYAAIKLALSWMGLDAGRVRRPFKALTPSREEAFRNDLIDIKNKYKDFECDLFKAL